MSIYRIQGETLEDMASTLRAAAQTNEELSPTEMIALMRTLSNVGMRAKDSSGNVIEGAEIFNDYTNNTAPYRYSTARGRRTTTYSPGQFVSGWGSGRSCRSAMLLTNDDPDSGGNTTYPNIFAVNWDGKVAAGSYSAALRGNSWKYQFEIANNSKTLFGIRPDGAPVFRTCYGFSAPDEAITSPEEGMIYFQLLEEET